MPNNSSNLLLTTTVVACNSNMTILPVQLHAFTLTQSNSTNLLRWQVATAEATSFEIERSNDGVLFYRIGQLTGTTTTYQFSDAAMKAAVYYRLRMIGRDGSISYSTTVFVEGKNARTMQIYLTLASDCVTVNLPQVAKSGEITVYGINGLQQQRITIGNNKDVRLSVENFQPGTYVVQYNTSTGKKMSGRFVKVE